MYRPRFIAVALFAAGLATACNENPAAPASRRLAVSSSLGSNLAVWKDQVSGVTADGADYAMFVPEGWSGDVVFYSHGIVAPLAPVSLPGPNDWDDAASLRDALGQAGFAVAYSSYGENGYAIAEGVKRTHQLRGLFVSKFGKPRRSYLVGHSLGAQVAQALAETYPSQYDGALAMCGVLGGTRMQIDYIGHARTLFDFFYPGVLPGNTMEMPVVITDIPSQIQGPVVGAVLSNPTGFGLIAASNQVQLAGANNTELLTSLINALAYQAIGVNDLLDRTHGHVLFDNTATVYNSALFPAAFYGPVNAGVRRYTATPDAIAWMEHNYEPTGDLRIPMITLHKTRDRLVPYRHEATYQARVVAAGETANLLQRSQNAFGHCDFGVQDVMTNFNDLVGWVSTGVRP